MNTRLLASLAAAAAAAFGALADEAADLQAVQPHGEGRTPVLLIGDSMMRILGAQSEKAFRKAGVEPVEAFSSLGSGLVRASVFDWTAKIDELIGKGKPKMVFVALGANDRQALEAPDGSVVNYADAERWQAEYAKLVGGVMDQLVGGGCETVVWLLPPDMKDSANQEHGQLVRKIAAQEALRDGRRGKVQLFDLVPVLSTRPGKYSQYKMSPTGEALSVRDTDGIHLSVDGAKLVAQALLRQYWGGKK